MTYAHNRNYVKWTDSALSYDLTQLGWKAFQNLACAVAAEVLKRPVQTFLSSRDGGRDAAYLGTWAANGNEALKSTIQCKFVGKTGATLTPSLLRDELRKASELAQQGLAEDYIVLTNAGVSGPAEAKICRAFEAVGVKTCRVFGGTWIVEQLTESARLRMLVPRVYGIGDLTQIIAENAYKQAKAILDSMGSDLSCFVPTQAYRHALEALHKHGFVILLGDPASGKSTIAAILALGAMDDGCIGALKINAPDQMNLWHPGEKQFLWVDDAFGPNQFDQARMSAWNAQLGALRAAVEGEARVVFTSRNYIWEAAKPHLKMSAFPLLRESQVVVNVQALSEDERAQMLYNHVRRVQPQALRQRLKRFLPAVASNKAFIPETARRLGDPLFTEKLEFSADRFKRLVERPIEFLTEILEQLDAASQAAVALIFLNSQTGVPSPISASPALDMVTRLMGVNQADVARAMQHLNDSLTRLEPHDDGNRWVFRHPTVTDAFASIVAASPELIELYVHGAKLDRLIREAACGPQSGPKERLRIPSALYGALVERLKSYPLDEALMSFLGAHCEKQFLERLLGVRPDILQWAATVKPAYLFYSNGLLLTALVSYGLLPEASRMRLIEGVTEHSISWLESKPLVDETLHKLFVGQEFSDYTKKFHETWLSEPLEVFSKFGAFSSEDELGMYTEFRDNLRKAQRFFGIDDDNEEFVELYSLIEFHIETLEPPSRAETEWTAPSSGSDNNGPATIDTIFDDVDN